MKNGMNGRRLVERDYFEALAQAITLDVWCEIIDRQISDAKSGDTKARDWIARHVLGPTPMTLTTLAEKEALGIEPIDEVLAAAESALEPDDPGKLMRQLGGQLEPSESSAHRVLRLKQERQRRASTNESSAPSDTSPSSSTDPIGSEPQSEK